MTRKEVNVRDSPFPTVPSSTRPTVYHRIRRQLGLVSPETFLRMARGGPRGFWAVGERWVAHAGVVADVKVAATDARGDGNRGRSRFRTVQARAKRIFARTSGEVPARIFGGFSFSSRHRAADVWSAFPSACFHLPAVEVEFHPLEGGSWLTVRDPDPARAEARCKRWAQALEDEDRGRGRPRPVGRGRSEAKSRISRALEDLPRKARFSGTGLDAWERMVRDALHRIRAGEAEKVVLARILEVHPARRIGPTDLAIALWRENQGSHVFLFEPVPGEALAGAAPERVAVLAGDRFRATAVAGSVAVGGEAAETARLARRLFTSAKDRAEHDFVVKDMVERLGRLGCDVRREGEPHVLTLARIQHLETRIAAEVPGGVSLMDLLGVLHPTPAVCGIPRDVALGILTESEVFERGWYAGPVGWLDSQGGGIFVPALRSAVCSGGKWRLFAGAGIVPGSDPALEWEETKIKFQPVLQALARAGRSGTRFVGIG